MLDAAMLRVLFLAALFSLMLSTLQYAFAGVFNSNWALASLAATLLLCFAFRARRRREVESVYFSFLSARPLIPITKEEAGVVAVAGTGVTQGPEGKGRSRTTQRLQRTADAAR